MKITNSVRHSEVSFSEFVVVWNTEYASNYSYTGTVLVYTMCT